MEELVVVELTEDEARSRSKMEFDELQEERERKREGVLERILDDNDQLYTRVAKLASHNRYHRLVGNHDPFLQREPLFSMLEGRIPGVGIPRDLVLFNDLDDARPKHVICHGHQFDLSTSPRYGAHIGERVSEGLGFAYQGADRQWEWNKDGPKEWARSRRLGLQRGISQPVREG